MKGISIRTSNVLCTTLLLFTLRVGSTQARIGGDDNGNDVVSRTNVRGVSKMQAKTTIAEADYIIERSVQEVDPFFTDLEGESGEAVEPTDVDTEPTDVDVDTEPTDVDAEPTDVDVETEPTDVDVETEPTDVDVETEPTDVDVETEPTDVDVEIEPTDVDVETEPTDVDVETEPTDVDVETEPTDVDVETEPTDVDVETEPTDVDVETEEDPTLDELPYGNNGYYDESVAVSSAEIDVDVEGDELDSENEESGAGGLVLSRLLFLIVGVGIVAGVMREVRKKRKRRKAIERVSSMGGPHGNGFYVDGNIL